MSILINKAGKEGWSFFSMSAFEKLSSLFKMLTDSYFSRINFYLEVDGACTLNNTYVITIFFKITKIIYKFTCDVNL